WVAAPPPSTPIPGGSGLVARPNVNTYPNIVLTLTCPLARRVLRPTPAGRSLKMPSPLVSRPVSSEYGGAELALTFTASRRLRTIWLLNETFMRCRTSMPPEPPPNAMTPGTNCAKPPPPAAVTDGPHSVASVPVGETLNGPSVLLRIEPSG